MTSSYTGMADEYDEVLGFGELNQCSPRFEGSPNSICILYRACDSATNTSRQFCFPSFLKWHWTYAIRSDTKSTFHFEVSDVHSRVISDEDVEMFLRLRDQWHVERIGALSSMAEIIACPSYLRIIGMGWRAVPLIIEQLEREGDKPDHWCAALEAVTGEDPVPEDDRGDCVRIAQAWIDWSRNRVACPFPTSTTPTIRSPAKVHRATTVLPGLRETT